MLTSLPTCKSYSKKLLLIYHFAATDKSLSRVRLCLTPETAAHQAPLSLGFSRQEHWSGLPFLSPMHESEKWMGSCSVMSDSYRPHSLQPTRLLHPWDFPGKSTGVGCHCLLQYITLPLTKFFLHKTQRIGALWSPHKMPPISSIWVSLSEQNRFLGEQIWERKILDTCLCMWSFQEGIMIASFFVSLGVKSPHTEDLWQPQFPEVSVASQIREVLRILSFCICWILNVYNLIFIPNLGFQVGQHIKYIAPLRDFSHKISSLLTQR